MDGVLNTTTNTVHKYQPRTRGSETACGATRFVATDRLDRVTVEHALRDAHAHKCGRCFSDGGGY